MENIWFRSLKEMQPGKLHNKQQHADIPIKAANNFLSCPVAKKPTYCSVTIETVAGILLIQCGRNVLVTSV